MKLLPYWNYPLKSILFGWLVAGLTMPFRAENPIDSELEPAITRIELDGTNVVISAQVPAGLKRVTLQSSQRLGTGAWAPRAVLRSDGQSGTVTFRLPRSPELEIVRVRGDKTDPLPSSFYRGTNLFPGVPVSTSVSPPGEVVFFSNGAGGVAVDNRATPSPTTDGSTARSVVESDIWKVDGDVLYFFNQYRGLQVIDLTTPDAPVVQATLSLPAAGEQMYVLPGSYVVLLARDGCGWSGDAASRVLVIDSSNKGANIVQSLPLTGQIMESRLVGTALYVMTQTYRPIANSKDGSWEWGTTIFGFDLAKPTAPVAQPSFWYPGYGNVLSATDHYLFISVADNAGVSLVHCIDISAPDGTLQKAASIRVAGTVTDKFKMNLDGEVLTVISEKWSTDNSNGRWRPVTRLENFSLTDPANAKKLGELKLADGEQLHATRFDGDRVYIVTYFRVDPLWVVDLSDPSHPTIKGELKVPGWSTYIQPMGDRLLSIGIDDTNGWRVAVSLFDVHDPTAPSLLSKVPLGENSSWSEANVDEKAFGFLPDAGLILVPYSSYSTNLLQGVQLIDFTRDTLTRRGFIAHEIEARRSTAFRDRILSISGRALLSVDATDRDHPIVRGEAELAWAVDRVFVVNQYLVELETSANSSSGASPVIRVAPVANPDQILNSLALPNLPVAGATVKDGRLHLLQGTTTYYPPIIFLDDKGESVAGTNQTSLVCATVDLTHLPDLGAVHSTTRTTAETFNGQVSAVWPKADVLVWATQPANYWWRGPFFPAIDVVSIGVGGLTIMPSRGLFWYPYGSYGSSTLYGVDVEDPSSPRFLPDVNLTATNGWATFSKPFAADNSVYLSRQFTETIITGTNYFAVTNTTYVVVTNLVTVTNIVKVPHEQFETNSVIVTNVVLTTVRNSLGTQPVVGTRGTTPASALSQVIAAGASHSLALAADGHVWAWGGNLDGQLGDALDKERSEPKPIHGLGGILSLASGNLHNLALKADGTVWAWGNDAFGQLGNGATPSDPSMPPLPELGSATPLQVTGLERVIAVGAGLTHSFGVKADGTLWAWGGNWAGQLGDGTFESQTRPVPVLQLSEVKQAAGGKAHSVALKQDGTVWTWGENDSGQLGDSSLKSRNVPGQVSGLGPAVMIACGHSHTIALLKDGTVWAWGNNGSGQLGDGTIQDRTQPGPVPGMSDVTAIACGIGHNLALKRDGSVWTWGRNQDGQLGEREKSDLSKPMAMDQLPPAVAVAGGDDHSLAVSVSGEVYAWGSQSYGQLGNGDMLTVTNLYTVTNYVTTTTWTVETQVVERPELVKVPQDTIVNNEQPIYTSRQVSYLHVIDYSAPATPLVRQPITIPGSLNGLSHDGAIVYLVGYKFDPGSEAATDGYEWLHACAYDGVACYLVDSHPLSRDWPHSVLVHEPYLYLTRPAAPDVPNSAALEIWSLAETGKLSKLAERKLNGTVTLLSSPSFDLLAAQEDNGGIELFDLTRPAELPQVGQGRMDGCLGWDLQQAGGSLDDGLWIPLGLYGTKQVEVKR